MQTSMTPLTSWVGNARTLPVAHASLGHYRRRSNQLTVAAAGPSSHRGDSLVSAAAAAPVVAPSNPPPPSQAEQPSTSKASFNWHQAWYPVRPISELDPNKPQKVVLLGIELVVWRDAATGKWAAARDRCPHRGARMSDGLLHPTTGSLCCAYHGWEFNTDGLCTRIPQAPSEAANQRACSNSRCHLAAFPVREDQDLLWVWPSDGPDAQTAAAAAPLPLVPENEDSSWVLGGGGDRIIWGYQYMPVDYTIAQENPFDPSHAPYLHERTIGMKREDALPMHMELQGDVSSGGFDLRHGGYLQKNKDMEATRTFIAPSTARVEYTYPTGKKELYTIYTVPAEPGGSHVIFKLVGKKMPKPFELLFRAAPKWLLHTNEDVGTEDRVVLHGQQQVLQGSGQLTAPKYFLPTPSDAGVAAFRAWLRDYGGSAVPYEGAPAGSAAARRLGRHQLLDRMSLHTQNCAECQKGLAISQAWVSIATAALGACALAAAAILSKAYVWSQAPPTSTLATLGAVALLALTIRTGFLQLQRRFIGDTLMPKERKAATSFFKGFSETFVKAGIMLWALAAHLFKR